MEPDLPVREGLELAPGQSGVYHDASGILNGGSLTEAVPVILHSTHRLMHQEREGSRLSATLRGPLETPGMVRVYTGGRAVQSLRAVGPDEKPLDVEQHADGPTLLIRFPNQPEGATLEIVCESAPK
jgi:hypothetical protein